MLKLIKNNNYKQLPSKRRFVDIYFILYLTALVILITGNNNNNSDNVEHQNTNIEFPFRIKAEKPILVCKILNDSTGKSYLLLDSINYIFEYGDVQDVRYEFAIEDIELQQRVQFTNSDQISNKMFSFKHDTINRSVIFEWYPNVYNLSELSNKTFNVYVTASANPNSYKNTDTAQLYNIMQASAQFSLIITDERYNIEDFISNNPANNNDNNLIATNNQTPIKTNLPSNTQLSAEFSIKPQALSIRGIAGDAWENEITCYGFSPTYSLMRSPKVEINNMPENNGGEVSATIVQDNFIVLRGKLPDAGYSKVTINVQRKGDLKEQKVSFTLYPISITSVNIPKTMYPNVEYNITPNLPREITGVSAYIKDKDFVRLRLFNNQSIKFKPDFEDIGKVLTFERYLDGKLFGQKYQIKIIDFPEPEITKISLRNKNEVILETVVYGTYSERNNANTVKEVKITGNAKYQPRYGQTHINRAELESYEQFMITPQDDTKPFRFDVIVIDQRGRTSLSKTWK